MNKYSKSLLDLTILHFLPNNGKNTKKIIILFVLSGLFILSYAFLISLDQLCANRKLLLLWPLYNNWNLSEWRSKFVSYELSNSINSEIVKCRCMSSVLLVFPFKVTFSQRKWWCLIDTVRVSNNGCCSEAVMNFLCSYVFVAAIFSCHVIK